MIGGVTSGDESGELPGVFNGGRYSAIELPEVRNRIIESYLLPPTQNLTRMGLVSHMLKGGGQYPADPSVTDPFTQADLLIRDELARLRAGNLYWVSPDMTQMCRAAAPGMPPFRPGPDDVPSPCGLMYFASPLSGYQTNLKMIISSGGSPRSVLGPQAMAQVRAVSWGPWSEQGRWPGGGTWFTFYTAGPSGLAEAARHWGISLEDAARLRLPPLFLDNELPCPASERVPLPRPLEEAVADPDSLYSWMHLVLCAFRLMTSQTAAVADEALPRPMRRRSGRAGVTSPGDPVRLVDLRPRAARRQAEGGVEGHRNGPQVRFPVSAHWRNQWYPRSGVHRPILIEEQIRGPQGAPFRPRSTVYLLRRPGEPSRPSRSPGPELG